MEKLSNLKIYLEDTNEPHSDNEVYAKVGEILMKNPLSYRVRITSASKQKINIKNKNGKKKKSGQGKGMKK